MGRNMILKWNIIKNSIRLDFAALPIVILELRNYYPTGRNRSLKRVEKCIVDTYQRLCCYMSFQFCGDIYTFADFTTKWSMRSCQDKKQSITNPKYLMLSDCSRYWLAIFRGGRKLELTFCLN